MTSQASYTITAVKDGNDLDSILMLWKKTTTNAAPAKPSGTNLNGWTEDMPEFESGAYVWTCNRVAISDPTASTPIYTYTDPVLDTHWKKLDEVYEQGTEIKNTVDNITLKYSNSNGEETSFKISNGAIDITLLKNQVDDAATTATNFISMRGDGGIEVGNKSGGSWTGYRSQMLADSFNILDESGNVLASYGANIIDLGLNKEGSVVRFCGGEAQISYNTTYDFVSIKGNNSIELTTNHSGSKIDISIGKDAVDIWYGGSEDMSIGSSLLIDFAQKLIDIPELNIRTLYGEIELRNTDIILGTIHSSVSPSKIRGTTQGVSWFRGREAATLIATGGTGTSAYFPVIDTKCNTGDWSMGCLGNNLYFVYTSNTDYTAENNVTSKFGIRNDGMPLLDGATPLIEYGTWTPVLQNLSGYNPSYSNNWCAGYYYRIGNMVFISCDISPNITSVDGSIAFIAGLPYTNMGVCAGLSMCEGYNVFDHGQSDWNIIARVEGGDSIVRFQSPTGSSALNWIANAGSSSYNPILSFSGWYRIA